MVRCRLCRKIAPLPEEKFLGKIGAYNSSVVVPQFHLESLSTCESAMVVVSSALIDHPSLNS